MTIYEFRTTINTNGKTGSQNTLRIPGGLMRQLLITTTGANTTFRFDMADENGIIRRKYDFTRAEIDDCEVFPMTGIYTMRVTDSIPEDTFRITMAVQEQ